MLLVHSPSMYSSGLASKTSMFTIFPATWLSSQCHLVQPTSVNSLIGTHSLSYPRAKADSSGKRADRCHCHSLSERQDFTAD